MRGTRVMLATAVTAAVAVGTAPRGLDAQRPPRVRLAVYGGPETSGFRSGSEAALRRDGYGDTTPVDCFIICGGGVAHPFSYETGTESFMVSLAVRVWRRVAVDVFAADGTGGDTRGYRAGAGENGIHFSEATIVGGIAAVQAGRVRLGAGPASLATSSGGGGPAGIGAASPTFRNVRPGGVVDLRVDLLRVTAVVLEARAQYRAFAATPVLTERGARHEVRYRSLFVGAGLGLQR